MEPEQAKQLGNYLRAARQAKGLSALQLAQLTNTTDGTIVRFENGKILTPAPDKLTRIAGALDLPLADVLSMADYPTVNELPSFHPYLRSKYRDLPDEAREAIEAYAVKIARKHGVALDGPAEGEDESP